MPKKFPQQNSKAVEANARKSAAKEAKQLAEDKAKEDAYWADDDKHVKKKEERKQAREQKKNEKLEKKQENLKLLEDEEYQLGGKQSTSASTGTSSKMTRHEIMLASQKSNENAAQSGDVSNKQGAGSNRLDDDEDDDRDLVPNMNREVGLNDTGARNVDEAIAQLSLGDGAAASDQHPEKRMKAALKSYEKSRLPALKGEQPGLRLSQYKEIIWKEFQKSPQNPVNQ